MNFMNEKEILSVSLASFLNVLPPLPEDLYYEGCILGQRDISTVKKVDPRLDLFRFPTRINAFGIVLCSKGSIEITSDLRNSVIRTHDLFVSPPGSIIQANLTNEANVYFIFCEEEFLNRAHIDFKQLMHLFMDIRENPCIHLDEVEWQEIILSLEEIFREGRKQRKDPISAEILYTLFRALAYRLCRIIDDQVGERSKNGSAKQSQHNRNTAYFNTFLEELSKHYLQERSVSFYAEQLHLTPKYLTTLLRTTTGRTASDWINEYVTLEAKNLLKFSTMSIQEIAYYLNFPNQSFFGRYFKQHTNMSPSAYRSSK